MQPDAQTTELLSAYLDGEVDPRQKAAVERLLDRDPEARALLADLRRNREILTGLPRHAAPASILTDVQAFTERTALLDDDDYHGISDRRTFRVFRRLIPLALAASLGFAALAGWYFYEKTLPTLKSGGPAHWPTEGESAIASLARAADRPLDEKLAAGLPADMVQAHPFAAEPVRLAITVENESQRKALLARLDAEMLSNSIADVTEPEGPEVRNQATAPAAFFVRGRAGVNHAADAPSQRLLRAPASQVAAILNDLPDRAAEPPRVELQAGPLQVVGQQQAVDLLNAVSGPTPDQSAIAFRESRDLAAESPGRGKLDVRAAKTQPQPEAPSLPSATTNTPSEVTAQDVVAEAAVEAKEGDREGRRSRPRGEESTASHSDLTDDRSDVNSAEKDSGAEADASADAKFLRELLRNVGLDPDALASDSHGDDVRPTGNDSVEEVGPPAKPGALAARRRSELERSSPPHADARPGPDVALRTAPADSSGPPSPARETTAPIAAVPATDPREFTRSAAEHYVTVVIEVKTAAPAGESPASPGSSTTNPRDPRPPRPPGSRGR